MEEFLNVIHKHVGTLLIAICGEGDLSVYDLFVLYCALSCLYVATLNTGRT